MTTCPDCSDRLDRIEALLRRLVGDDEPVELETVADSAPEEFLEPCVIAGRLGISEAYVRKLCSRGQILGEPGIEKPGGRWRATTEAIDKLRRVSGAF